MTELQTKSSEYQALIGSIHKLLTTGSLLEGTLARIPLKSSTRYQLTYKENNKTKTVYIPIGHVPEVEEALANWKTIRSLLKEAANVSLQTLRQTMEQEKIGPKDQAQKPNRA